MKIYATKSGEALAQRITYCLKKEHTGDSTMAVMALAKRLMRFFEKKNNDVEYVPVEIGAYPDGSIWNKVPESPRNENAVIVGNTLGPVQSAELYHLLCTVQRFSGVRKTALVIPYFGAGRQDQPPEKGGDTAGVDEVVKFAAPRPNRIIFVDLHNNNLLKCTALDSRIRVEELYAKPVFLDVIRNMNLENFVFAAADAGRFAVARSYAKRFDVGAVSLDKRRKEESGEAEIMHVVGDVRGKTVILVDDIVDSGGTALKGALALRRAGACDIHLFSTHTVLSGRGKEFFARPPKERQFSRARILFSSMHTADTIPLDYPSLFRVHSVAALIADFIKKEIPT